MNTPVEISIIIVNYNVCDFILQALHSIQRALCGISYEIFVVDNNSSDGSTQLIQKHFPDVKLIKNHKNLGFAAANNIALRHVLGEYIVLINPDTVVREDTFIKLIKFMDKTSEAGAATCKILNPDGSFAVDCRHSIPSPMTAFWKFIGFSRLFPRSKIFGRYNLTFLDTEKTYPVDSISGSFMFIRKTVIDQIGFLDDNFFMYCEDIDYCYRINNAGWKIYYMSETSIIHYKGESTKKNHLDYIINFNKSLYLFYKKHFQNNYVTLFRWLIFVSIFIRGIFVFFKNLINSYSTLIFDLLIINLSIFVSFILMSDFVHQINIKILIFQSASIYSITSLFYLLTSYFLEVYSRFRLSLIQIIKANSITFLLLLLVIVFFKWNIPYRNLVLIPLIISTLIMIAWRIIFRFFWYKDRHTFTKKIFQKRTVLVGTDKKTASLVQKFKNHIQAGYKLIGLISVTPQRIGEKIEGLKILTSLDKLSDFVQIENINQIIFSTHNISYKTIIKTISQMNTDRVEFKIAPENLEVIIGKSVVYRLSDLPLVDIEYAFGKPFNRFTKRLFDLIASTVILLTTFPIWSFYFLLKRKSFTLINIWGNKGRTINIVQRNSMPFKGFINNLLCILYIVNGDMSFVGAPIRLKPDHTPVYFYKPGLTGLSQINQTNGRCLNNGQKYELFYLKNYNILLDIAIIFKSMFSKKK